MSRFGGEWCTAAQYFSEVVIERQARHAGKELKQLFWRVAPWSSLYRQQVALAQELLHDYTPHQIATALKTGVGRTTFSFASPLFRELLSSLPAVIPSPPEEPTPSGVEPPPTPMWRDQPFSPGKSLADRLADL